MLDWSLAGQKALQAMEESEDISEEMTPVETDQQLNSRALTIATTTPFDEISPTDLKTFVNDSSRVEIRWRGENLTDGTYDHRIISTDYPASVAYACSGFCAARMKRSFETDSTLGLVSCISSGNRFVFTLIGPECDYEASCELFSCLVDYCRGGGSASLPSLLPRPLLRTLKLMDVSQALGVSFLARRLEQKLIGLRTLMPSAGELRAIIQYCRRDRCEDVQHPDETSYHGIVDHIATATVSGRLNRHDLQHIGVFQVLYNGENHRFMDDVRVAVEMNKASLRATTARYKKQPVSDDRAVLKDAWTKARIEIERCEAEQRGPKKALDDA